MGNGDALLNEACEITAKIGADGTGGTLFAEIRQLARRRRALWLRANREGATYVHMAERCGLSESVITREIRRARQETRSPRLAQRAPRHRAAR